MLNFGTREQGQQGANMSNDVSVLAKAGQQVDEIPVPISYDIIHLFSEGLYQSPNKAIEELVSNSYDANAQRVHILLPEQPTGKAPVTAPLWVIDDGHGMDEDGFRQLWRIADSNKSGPQLPNGRAPIGQFGIGKLAAYVLAWNLMHISRVKDRLLLTSMDFHRVTGRQADTKSTVSIALREVDEATARGHLAEIERRDPAAWKFMFEDRARSPTWTAAALSEFKDLYSLLRTGRLRWVLSTGLPLHSQFRMWLNGQPVVSSKANLKAIKVVAIDETLPGIGPIRGEARIHEKLLTTGTGKSEQLGRSHGFFVRVRGRVINLEDELFGINALNHAAWPRFALEIDADGLRDHLLSSREGVRDSAGVLGLRQRLHEIFNECRSAYEAWERKNNEDIDIEQLLSDSPNAHVTDPLIQSVRKAVESGVKSFYITPPHDIGDDDRTEWIATHVDDISKSPFDKTEFQHDGSYAPALRYEPATRRLIVNRDHPFVDKLTNSDKRRGPGKLFALAEVLLEGLLQEQRMDSGAVAAFMTARDRVLRLMAGEAPPTASEVVRRLEVAREDHAALERATGEVFRVLGFEYARKGGHKAGPDGVLYARLGRHGRTLADYVLVYDAKQTNHPSVPAEKIDLASLEDFRKQEKADFGFFIAAAYAAESDIDGALNRRITSQIGERLTLLTVKHLSELVWLHYRHGVTLSELRSLFEEARTVPEVDAWIDATRRAREQSEVPLRVLLEGLEQAKSDQKATPNVYAVRAKLAEALENFEPERLIDHLKAVENLLGTRWIEVEDSGDVLLHQTVEQVLVEVDRNINYLAEHLSQKAVEPT